MLDFQIEGRKCSTWLHRLQGDVSAPMWAADVILLCERGDHVGDHVGGLKADSFDKVRQEPLGPVE